MVQKMQENHCSVQHMYAMILEKSLNFTPHCLYESMALKSPWSILACRSPLIVIELSLNLLTLTV